MMQRVADIAKKDDKTFQFILKEPYGYLVDALGKTSTPLCYIMYLGRIVEIADKEELFARPRHPYTRALISAAPLPDPGAKRERIVLEGDVPSPMSPPRGCHFHTRCPFAVARCRADYPELRSAGPMHHFACHLDL